MSAFVRAVMRRFRASGVSMAKPVGDGSYPYRIAAEMKEIMEDHVAKLEMDDNTMRVRLWSRIVGLISAVIVWGIFGSQAVSWHEATLNVETARIKASPAWLKAAEADRDRAMYESMARGKPAP